MKRMLLPPIFVLAALLAFSLWNIRHMEEETDRWREQLQAADRLALSGEWAEALDALACGLDIRQHDGQEVLFADAAGHLGLTRSCPTSGTSCGSLRRWKR